MSHASPSSATLARRLDELQGEHDQLMQAFAHDFDASLRQTRQFAGLLVERAGADANPELRRYADLLRRAIERSADMIEGVRTVSHPALVEGEPVAVDCAALVRETFASIDTDAVTFAFDGPAPAVATGHPTQLRTLFRQLVDNAVRHRRPGVPGRVEVTAEPCGSGWRFEVRDDGAGFPSERREGMFVLFRNIDSGERNVRVGVGLPLCRSIVRRHGGDIRCLRGAPGDTCIAFTLGAALPDPAPVPR